MVTMYLTGFYSGSASIDVVNRLGFNDFNHFAAFVFPAMRASAVSANFLVAIRAFRQLRDLYRVMRPASRGAPLRMAAFGIWHSFPSLSILVRNNGIKPRPFNYADRFRPENF